MRRRIAAVVTIGLCTAVVFAPAAGANETIVDGDGGIFVTSTGVVVDWDGDEWYSGLGSQLRPGETVVSLAHSNYGGHWIFTSTGRVLPFGARWRGDLGSTRLNSPIVEAASSANGQGYYMVAADGGVFAFGDATFHGSLGGVRLNAPIVDIAVTEGGYWLAAADGGVFAFGAADFHGSMGGRPMNARIVGIASSLSRPGYWLAGEDGGVFAFGAAPFLGSDTHPTFFPGIVDIEASYFHYALYTHDRRTSFYSVPVDYDCVDICVAPA